MAPPSKLIGLTAEEKVARERERNRRKSAALRARKKQQQKDKAEEGGTSSWSAQQGSTGGKEEPAESLGNDTVIKRLIARLAELGEGDEEIGKLVGGVESSFESGPPSLTVASPVGLEMETPSVGWDLAECKFSCFHSLGKAQQRADNSLSLISTVDVSANSLFPLPRMEYRSAAAEEREHVTLFGAVS